MAVVLVVDDERGVREGLCRAVATAGHKAIGAEGVTAAREALGREAVDCVLLDVRLKDGDGLKFLEELRAGRWSDVPVIMATAYGDSERTIEAMRLGAFDYVTKPFDLTSLLGMVERAIRQRELSRAVPRSAAPVEVSAAAEDEPLVGTSAGMLSVWKVIGRAAASDAAVLVTGETGTGKELVARAIHKHSTRRAGPFVAVNLSALPPTLIESELFGHEKGAFTGAVTRKAGRIEMATGGTLFLDEIGDLDLALQTKLLRVLQDGRYERVGGTETLIHRARVIAATNKPVRPGAPGAALREDLYYRLAVIEIELPPLRNRKSDIPMLVAHALTRSPARAVSEEALALLSAYHWPGNVRELTHVVQRAAVLCGAEVIDVHDLPESVRASTKPAAGPSSSEGLTLREAVAALEKRMIVEALEAAGGNRAEAARRLGIARPQLYTKLEEHGLANRG